MRSTLHSCNILSTDVSPLLLQMFKFSEPPIILANQAFSKCPHKAGPETRWIGVAAVSQGLGTAAAHARPGLGLCLISSIALSFLRLLPNQIAAFAECEANRGDPLGFRDEWGNWGRRLRDWFLCTRLCLIKGFFLFWMLDRTDETPRLSDRDSTLKSGAWGKQTLLGCNF